MRFFRTLIFRVLVGSCLLLFGLFALYSYMAVRFHTGQVMEEVFNSANRMSDVIKNSTHYSMLLNRREDVFQIISTIGREPGVEGIRIYNKRGVIMFSTNKAEEMSVVNMHAEACYVCHDTAEPLKSLPINVRTRTYTSPAGKHVLGLINPIRNEPVCSNATCHAHPPDRTVLGVLDVRMSLDKVDANIRQAKQRFILYALALMLVVALASGLFLFFAVHRPVRRLREGTRQIASGNLRYRIPHLSRDEIGELAHSFNIMSQSLERAQREKQQWSEMLERRIQDKTKELQEVHSQILQIEKMASLGTLSATVAHELNNPLEGILTYAKLIAKRLRKASPADAAAHQTLEELELIILEVERCGNIVKNLLLFSKKGMEEISVVPVQDIVERAIRLVQHHMQLSNVAVEARYEAPDAKFLCDANQVEQALVALMVNAVEAMPGGGTLRLTVRRNAGEDPQILLEDTGVGIAPHDIPRIFEPFFTTKKEGHGVGLGLSVVYGIVERQGGAIAVQSEVGKGTLITLTFPSATAQPPRLRPSQLQSSPAQKARA